MGRYIMSQVRGQECEGRKEVTGMNKRNGRGESRPLRIEDKQEKGRRRKPKTRTRDIRKATRKGKGKKQKNKTKGKQEIQRKEKAR